VKKKLKTWFKWSSLVFLFLAGLAAWIVYQWVYKPNVKIKESRYFYIATGSDYDEVFHDLKDQAIISDPVSFDRVARKKEYPAKVKPGRYKIKPGMSNNELVNLLRSGLQEPVLVTFNNIRFKDQLAGRVCRNLEADSTELLRLMNDSAYLKKEFGLKPTNIMSLFIPNSYEFYWNTSAEQFLKRMAKEYKAFWTEERKKKAKEIGLTQTEVSVLASIVQCEQQYFNDEKKIIAGLYINRLKKNHPLESDPTLMFAHGNFSMKRVLNIHKEIESPYNTYKNKGLPPGPITLPEISSLDAVLYYTPNNYFFMCAKDDFSGRHYFSVNYSEHLKYARMYQKALDKRGIKQ
jgi:UPF0755 protein